MTPPLRLGEGGWGEGLAARCRTQTSPPQPSLRNGEGEKNQPLHPHFRYNRTTLASFRQLGFNIGQPDLPNRLHRAKFTIVHDRNR